jgi:hypothetical protein
MKVAGFSRRTVEPSGLLSILHALMACSSVTLSCCKEKIIKELVSSLNKMLEMETKISHRSDNLI